MKIEFFTFGKPIGQPRARAAIRNKKGGGATAGVYDSGGANGWKFAIALAAKPYIPAEPIPRDVPVRVVLEAYFPRPKDHYNKKGLKDTAPEYHLAKPDRDNLDKAVLDILTELRFWCDDCQVCTGGVIKKWADLPHNAGARITITTLE